MKRLLCTIAPLYSKQKYYIDAYDKNPQKKAGLTKPNFISLLVIVCSYLNNIYPAHFVQFSGRNKIRATHFVISVFGKII